MKVTPEIKNLVIQMYLSGSVERIISARVGVSKTTVNKILVENGIERRAPGTRYVFPENLLKQLYSQNIGSQKVADILGVSKTVVLSRLRKLGIVRPPTKFEPGDKNFSWKGGYAYHHDGYVYKRTGDHYTFEHRVVMEGILGRKLEKGEIVHHINEIRNDNRPENLKVMSRPEHMVLHHLGKKRPKIEVLPLDNKH